MIQSYDPSGDLHSHSSVIGLRQLDSAIPLLVRIN